MIYQKIKKTLNLSFLILLSFQSFQKVALKAKNHQKSTFYLEKEGKIQIINGLSLTSGSLITKDTLKTHLEKMDRILQYIDTMQPCLSVEGSTYVHCSVSLSAI